jgi:hypothetical protein
MKQLNNWSSETIGGLASVFPIVFLAGLIGVIVMAAKKIKKKIENVKLPKDWVSVLAYAKGMQGEKLSDMKKIADGASKPKPNFFKLVFKQWQFWAIIALFVLVIVVAIINSNQNIVSPVLEQQPRVIQPTQSAEVNVSPENATFQQTIVNTFGTTFKGIASFMDLIILIFVLGFIVSLFIKLGHWFK